MSVHIDTMLNSTAATNTQMLVSVRRVRHGLLCVDRGFGSVVLGVDQA